MELERKRLDKQQQLSKTMDALQKDDIEGKRIPEDPHGDLAKLDQKRKLESRHQRERSNLDTELGEFYQCEAKEREVKETQQRLKSADNLWGALTGRKAQVEDELKVANLNLNNARMRERERIDALVKKQAAERLELIGPETNITPRLDFNRAANGISPTPQHEPVVAATTKRKQEPLRAERVAQIPEGELKPLPGYQGIYSTKTAKTKTQEKAQREPEQKLQRMPKIETTQSITASNDNLKTDNISGEFNRSALDHNQTEEAQNDMRETIRQKMRSRQERDQDGDRGR